MAVVRATPPLGEEPWLIRQFGPNTKDPMSATHWRDKPMSGVQMMAGRQNLLKEYPMNAKFDMSINSYASRRAGSNLLSIINADAVIRNAHASMADVYTENREMVSAKAKTLVAGVIQLTIKRLGKTDFRWGDIPAIVQKADRDKILDDASKLYTDVKVPERDREFVTENMSLDLPAEAFLDEDVSAGIWNTIHGLKPEPTGATPPAPEPGTSDEEESLASSIDSSGDDAGPEHLADIHRIETSKLVTGKSNKSSVHVADPADDGLSDRWELNCSIGLWRATATSGDLLKMKDTGKPFCPTCTSLWPLHIKQSITVATRGALRGS